MGLLRGFLLQTRTYSRLLTVSINLTCTLLYMDLASPKYPRYCKKDKTLPVVHGILRSPLETHYDATLINVLYWHLHCWWQRTLVSCPWAPVRTSVAGLSEPSRWLVVRPLPSMWSTPKNTTHQRFKETKGLIKQTDNLSSYNWQEVGEKLQ